MRTLASFESSVFNQNEPRDYFLNPQCYGDDACRWLIKRLRAAALETDEEPRQEDFGWYFHFTVPAGQHCCVVGARPGNSGARRTWVLWLERERGLLTSVLGGRSRGISPTAGAAIHAALSAPEIENLRWHEKIAFDRGDETGYPQP